MYLLTITLAIATSFSAIVSAGACAPKHTYPFAQDSGPSAGVKTADHAHSAANNGGYATSHAFPEGSSASWAQSSYPTIPIFSNSKGTASPSISRTCYPAQGYDSGLENHGSTLTLTSTKAIITVTTTIVTTPITTVSLQLSAATETFLATDTVTVSPSVITNTISTTLILTFTDTTNITVTSTQSNTATSVITSAVSTSTSIVPTPSGFVPIYDSTGDSSEPATRKKKGRRDFDISSPRLAKKGNSSPSPDLVTCIDYVQVFVTKTLTQTAPTSTVSPRGSATTIDTTNTVTVTITASLAPASTTIVITSSTTISQSFTTTSITTVVATTSTTVYQSTTTTTSYAACATNNLLGPVLQNGYTITQASGPDGSETSAAPGVTTAYDCCVFCINTPTCLGTQFEIGDTPADSTCLYFTLAATDTCSQSANQDSFVAETNPAGHPSQILSNGLCGEYPPPLLINN